MRYLAVIVGLALVSVTAAVSAAPPSQTLPCDSRPTRLNQPWMPGSLSCLEEVVNDPDAGELAFTALAVAPDGTLYATRPLAGDVLAFDDSDGDGLPDTARVVASGLTLPNGLDYADGALYISGGSHLYRLRDGVLGTLVSDLPAGGGFWTGGVAVGGGRIYVETGAPCDDCAPADPARGAVLSYALDGSDSQIVASGLRQPTDLAFMGGDLYVLDSARSGLFDTPDLDELNRIPAGTKANARLNFGFPYCVGSANTPDMPGFNCAEASAPIIAFPTASTPSGIAAYRGDAIPSLQGKLLVTLGGAYNSLDLRGYMVVIADPNAGTYTALMPARPDISPASDFTLEEMNYRGSGFFPHRPLDVAVSDAGWVYISVGGGRILCLRP